MEKTVEYWEGKIAERIREHDYCFLEHWEDEDSYEIYTTDEMDEALVGAETIRQWDQDYSDESGRNYCLHLYAYVKGTEVEYKGVLYDDVEKGSNEYAELNMDENFRKALTEFILKYNSSEKHTICGNMETKIIIFDADYERCVLGLLTVKGKTAIEIGDIIAKVKAEVDLWTWEDILERFRSLKIDFSWEENVNSISV